MSAQYKSKAEVKAEQTSQDKPSQDASNGSIPTIQGLETSLEMLYSGHRAKAKQITQGIKVQAYMDELEDAMSELREGEVQPDFLKVLQKNYIPALTQNQVLMPSQSLSPVGAELDDQEPLTDADETLSVPVVDHLIERMSELEKIKVANLTDAERTELHEVRIKLLKLGMIE